MLLYFRYRDSTKESFLDYFGFDFIQKWQRRKQQYQAQTNWLNQLKNEGVAQDAITQYQAWVGYLYAHPEKNGLVLDDFKDRAFQPGCLFRRDWYSNNPTTEFSFIAPATANEATSAYVKFLNYLSSKEGTGLPLLQDARNRFFIDGCGFLNPKNVSDYSTNITAVFQ